MIHVRLPVVDLNDVRADPVEEITVVSHHQQAQSGMSQIFFEPFGHLKVEVVRRFVEDQQVGFGDQRIGQSDPLDLTAGQLSGRLIKILNFQLREDLLDPRFVVPGILRVHFGHRPVQNVFVCRRHRLFVGGNGAQRGRIGQETGVQHGRSFGKRGILFQISHFQIPAERDPPRLVILAPGNDVEQSRFARPVLRNQSDTLTFADSQRQIFEKHPVAERFDEPLHLKITDHKLPFFVQR